MDRQLPGREPYFALTYHCLILAPAARGQVNSGYGLQLFNFRVVGSLVTAECSSSSLMDLSVNQLRQR